MTDDAGVAALERAVALARDYSPLPDFTDAICGLVAQVVVGVISGPISDQSDRLAMLTKLTKRGGK